MSLKQLLKKALSGEEILKILDGKAKVVRYSEIYKYSNVFDLMGPHKAAVILYEWKPFYGHWTALFEQNTNTIEFFDPYGIVIDNELKHVPNNLKKQLHSDDRYLSKLIIKSPYKNIEYNNIKFQKLAEGINTCGRHVAIRLLFRSLSLDEFAEIFRNSKDFDADHVMTLLTGRI